MPDHGGDEFVTDKRLARSLVRQFKRNACAAAEHVKYDPWQREYRRVAAEVEGTGNQRLFADFERRFLMARGAALPA